MSLRMYFYMIPESQGLRFWHSSLLGLFALFSLFLASGINAEAEELKKDESELVSPEEIYLQSSPSESYVVSLVRKIHAFQEVESLGEQKLKAHRSELSKFITEKDLLLKASVEGFALAFSQSDSATHLHQPLTPIIRVGKDEIFISYLEEPDFPEIRFPVTGRRQSKAFVKAPRGPGLFLMLPASNVEGYSSLILCPRYTPTKSITDGSKPLRYYFENPHLNYSGLLSFYSAVAEGGLVSGLRAGKASSFIRSSKNAYVGSRFSDELTAIDAESTVASDGDFKGFKSFLSNLSSNAPFSSRSYGAAEVSLESPGGYRGVFRQVSRLWSYEVRLSEELSIAQGKYQVGLGAGLCVAVLKDKIEQPWYSAVVDSAPSIRQSD